MDRFDAMLLFTRIVELRAFGKAADSLHLPRATASLVIRQLEARLGVQLLQRTTRHVSPTADGAAYYQRCVSLPADLEEAESAFGQAGQQAQGVLRVDMPSSLGRQVLLPALPDFCRRYPRVRLEMGFSDRQVDLVREGVDCVLRAGELPDSSLVGRRIAALEQITCASAGYLAEFGEPRTLDDLAQHRAVNYQSASNGRILDFEFNVDGQLRTLALPSVVTVNHADAYVAACRAGFGLIQAPLYHLGEDLRRGSVIEVLPAWRPSPLLLNVLYPSHRQLSRRLRVFVDWLVELFAAPVG
ncbi:MAG: HTH-type transcriptional regulator DmlR [Stenotrophomonas maltophilia]|nr:MAG: HTH-type transcriptional regulator DmlR [Stenotrophomonas maltophilia]